MNVALGLPVPVPKFSFNVNLRAVAFPFTPPVTPIPIISPSNPSIVDIKSTSSFFIVGNGANTWGGLVWVYPKPGLVIVTVFRRPFDIETVAVAVVRPEGGEVDVVIE